MQVEGTSFTWRQAVATSSFWFISIGHAMSLLAVSSVLMHLIPHLTNGLKLDLVTASLIFSVMTGLQMTGMLIGGFLGDHFNKRIVSMVCGATAQDYWPLYGRVLSIIIFGMHGLSWGIRGPLMGTELTTSALLLRHDHGYIVDDSDAGMTAGPLLCGWLYDIYK